MRHTEESPGWRAWNAISNVFLVVAALIFAAFLYAALTYKPDPWQQMTPAEQEAFKRQADQSYQQNRQQRSGW